MRVIHKSLSIPSIYAHKEVDVEVADLLTIETQVTLVMAVLAIVGVINTILTFVEKVKKAKKPHDDHIEMVQRHEEKLLNDYELIKEMQAEQRILLQNDLLIMEHIIAGNHVDKLKEQRDFIQRYLIDKR